MSSEADPEIILYDLACAKGVCFSPVVWKIRMILNYKKIPYKTIFLEFQDIEPTLKSFGIPPHDPSKAPVSYTVPTIHVPARNLYLMDSNPIAEWLESNYPSPPLQLTSELGTEIETKGRAELGGILRGVIMPREVRILNPSAAEYFRRTREARLGGRTLEDLLENDAEVWKSAEKSVRELGEMLTRNKDKGPYILGDTLSYTDFWLAGFLQCCRVVDEKIWERYVEFPGYMQIYEAGLPFMGKKD